MTKYEGTKLADFAPIDSVDALQIIDIEEGTGAVVEPGATITAHYTGALCKNGAATTLVVQSPLASHR